MLPQTLIRPLLLWCSNSWSAGGWGSDNDFKNLGPGARANLKVLFEWSGARGIDLDPEPVNTPLRNYFQNIVDTIKWARGGAGSSGLGTAQGGRMQPGCARPAELDIALSLAGCLTSLRLTPSLPCCREWLHGHRCTLHQPAGVG